MDIAKISGEEIAKLISQEYQKLMVVNQNLQALNTELSRREKKEEPKKK